MPSQCSSARRFPVLSEKAAVSCPSPAISSRVPPGSTAASRSIRNPSASLRNAASTFRAVRPPNLTAPALSASRRLAPGVEPAKRGNRSRHLSKSNTRVESRASISVPPRQSTRIAPVKRWSATTASMPVKRAPSGPSRNSESNVPAHGDPAAPRRVNRPEKTKPAAGFFSTAPTATASMPPSPTETVTDVRSRHFPIEAATSIRRPSSAAFASSRYGPSGPLTVNVAVSTGTSASPKAMLLSSKRICCTGSGSSGLTRDRSKVSSTPDSSSLSISRLPASRAPVSRTALTSLTLMSMAEMPPTVRTGLGKRSSRTGPSRETSRPSASLRRGSRWDQSRARGPCHATAARPAAASTTAIAMTESLRIGLPR